MRREHVRNKLRKLGYEFKRDAWRVQEWKRSNPRHVVMLPKRDDLSEEWVRSTLRQCGCEPAEIDEFIRHSKC